MDLERRRFILIGGCGEQEYCSGLMNLRFISKNKKRGGLFNVFC